MDRYTAMSDEGVAAVKREQRRQQLPSTGYKITTAGPWTQDFGVLRTALLDYQDLGTSETAVMAEDMVDELHVTDGLVLSGEAFDVLVDALVARWESHGDDAAGSFLSSIAETLGIEFI
jgi:hypothetical protein